MNILGSPVALPGCCAICRAGNNRRFYVDTGMSLEFHGVVYICDECIGEASHTSGYISPELADKLKAENEYLNKYNDELSAKLEVLERSLHDLRSVGYISVEQLDNSSRSLVGSAVVTAETLNRDASVDSGEGADSKSPNDKGVDELRSNDSGDGGSEFKLDF